MMRRSEGALQAQIRATLSDLGYLALEVGRGRKRVQCPECKAAFYPRGWQGNSEGAPDLLIALPAGPGACGGLFLGMELKTATGRVRAAQAALAEAGATMIIRSVEEAVRAVLEHETRIRQVLRLQAFLEQNEGRID